MVIEAARAGYRVLVSANNPIARCLLEMAACAPGEEDLQAALAELAASHRGDERIEPHIRSLYMTECAGCGRPVMAEYFLWERGASAPYARFYRCPQCGDEGERPATHEDVKRAEQFASGGLHRARALERVAPRDDPDRPHAEEALSVYLPRAVYALFTLINRLDALQLPSQRRLYLQALLLTACDQGNTLWPYPTERERPRQLTIPPRFRENNIWLALEQSIRLWVSPGPAVPLSLWPQEPPAGGGITLFQGRLRDLAVAPTHGKIEAVLAALPRPNQAFWTLSALWAGWLWGREATAHFKSVLRRRRYDWAWHTAALSAAFGSLKQLLQPGTAVFSFMSEAEPGFMGAALVAAEEAGLELEGLALRPDDGQAQILWQSAALSAKTAGGPQPAPDIAAVTEKEPPLSISVNAALETLRKRGQPAGFLLIYTAALQALIEAHALPHHPPSAAVSPNTSETEPTPAEHFSRLQALLREAFSFRNGFLRYQGSDQSQEVGQWWIRDEGSNRPEHAPLADQVEIAMVRFLQKHSGCTFQELDTWLCASFPGLLTPEVELVQVCLDSYGEQELAEHNLWHLRPADQPSARRADLEATRLLAKQLGERLGFELEGMGETPSEPFHWVKSTTGQKRHFTLYILASAAFGEIILKNQSPSPTSLIILPGSRANLVAYKLRNDPHISQKVAEGWRFVKYRQLRWLLDTLLVTKENLTEQLDLDPLTFSAPQLRLL